MAQHTSTVASTVAACPRSRSSPPGTKLVASNRQARRDYEILDTFECGIELKGEVKLLRDASSSLTPHARAAAISCSGCTSPPTATAAPATVTC